MKLAKKHFTIWIIYIVANICSPINAEIEDTPLNIEQLKVELTFILQPENNKKYGNIEADKYMPYLEQNTIKNPLYPTTIYSNLNKSIEEENNPKQKSNYLNRIKNKKIPHIHKVWTVLLEQNKNNKWKVDFIIPTEDNSKKYHISGNIQLKHQHYYDLSTKLNIEEFNKNNSITLIEKQEEKRRMKLNTLHYLDHEIIGIIAKITSKE